MPHWIAESILQQQTITPHALSGLEQHSLSYQNLNPKQLAARLNVPHSWILDNAASRSDDPIPCLSLGKFKRFRWGSPELIAWIERHVECRPADDVVPAEPTADHEYLDSAGLAARLNISESWVRDQVRSRCGDPIPHARFGRYVRFRWGSPELETWAEHRMLFVNNGSVSRAKRKETIQ